jgi:hypothetical protein
MDLIGNITYDILSTNINRYIQTYNLHNLHKISNKTIMLNYKGGNAINLQNQRFLKFILGQIKTKNINQEPILSIMDKIIKTEHSDFDWSIDIDIRLPKTTYNKIVNDVGKIVFLSLQTIKEKIDDLLKSFNINQFIFDIHKMFFLQKEHIAIFDKYNMQLSLVSVNSFNYTIRENNIDLPLGSGINDTNSVNSYIIRKRKPNKNILDYIEVDHFIEDIDNPKRFFMSATNVYITHATTKIIVYDYDIKYNIYRVKIHTSAMFNNTMQGETGSSHKPCLWETDTFNLPIELIDIAVPCQKSDSHRFIQKTINSKNILTQESLFYKSKIKFMPPPCPWKIKQKPTEPPKKINKNTKEKNRRKTKKEIIVEV